ncbi:MAG: NADH-quinone oxidoreductase subunit L [Chloroflexi bacterium]|nr:NADH-quinone oxidoreductase subunit L [Chloroflexota bacterium]
MISELQAWSILFLPLASFVFISLFIRPFLGSRSRLSAYVTIAAIGLAFLLSLYALRSTVSNGDVVGWDSHVWLAIDGLEIRIGILMDPLTAVMLVVVTGVSLLVQVYSQGYMKDDPSYARYFAFMSLFTASMVGIGIARSIIQRSVFWELVGLCSYLLIGFWHQRPAAAAAAKKAFLVTRIGDVGFLLAILYLFMQRTTPAFAGLDPFEIPNILTAAAAMTTTAVTWTALGIFAGAMGKSGQFPLHTWLPDAMEGPTPVSSLIHAATMVAAGVFLTARFFPLFEESATAMTTVALVGGFTAVFAATMGLVMFDIKRVLAYSTVSQLGYMMLAIGVGAPGVAIFHLFTHAFFKCLLFLGAGSVNHATGTFDMRYMGGLRKVMPWTYATFLLGALSLAGVFPLAGFWSKDEILGSALKLETTSVHTLVFWLALAAVFLTAFYMFRVIFMTFHGEFRGGVDAEHPQPAQAAAGHDAHGDSPIQEQAVTHSGHGGGRLAESPLVMVGPMAVLAALAVGAGYVANPLGGLAGIPAHWFVEFLGEHAETFDAGLALGSSVVALAGIGLAFMVYMRRSPSPESVGKALAAPRTLLFNKYYLDVLYEDVIVRGAFYKGLARSLNWFDREVIDRLADGIGWIGRNAGRAFLPLQNGQTQGYGLVFSFGILVILGAYFLFGR